MAEQPAESVQMVVTSPPYWGLRKYSGEQDLIWGGDKDCQHEWDMEKITAETWNKDGHVPAFGRGEQPTRANRPSLWQKVEHLRGFCQLCGAWKGAYGLEPIPEMYVQHTIEILREIRRVLRKDGVVFWNIGDSYCSTAPNTMGDKLRQTGILAGVKPETAEARRKFRPATPQGMKPKDLCLIPFRVAIAAQEDGWWVRSDIIWSKPNPMPESVTDRPTNSHEYILMLTKSAKYYWDQEAVREAQTGNAHSRGTENGNEAYQEARGSYKDFKSPVTELPAGRNLRSVWTFPTQPYSEAHFAVFPEKLPELCINAATPEVGCCSKCGAPWARVLEKGFNDHDAGTEAAYKSGTSANRLAKLRQSAREQGDEYTNEHTKGGGE